MNILPMICRWLMWTEMEPVNILSNGIRPIPMMCLSKVIQADAFWTVISWMAGFCGDWIWEKISGLVLIIPSLCAMILMETERQRWL